MLSRLFRTAVIAIFATYAAQADDWPQVLGPDRNGVSNNETLPAQWPKAGPGTNWEVPVGQGFAGVAVKQNRVYLFHRKGRSEVLECLDADTGRSLWQSSVQCRYAGGYSSDSGPRCVPLVDGQFVYTFGVAGTLRCLDIEDGDEVWKRETWTDYNAPEGYFGAGSSPAIVDGLVIVNVGGRSKSAVVAFDTDTGDTRWKSFEDTASYSSPIVATIDGIQHLLVVTRMHTLSLNPVDGKVRFEFPFGMRGPTVNGATPVVIKDHVFVSSSYRVGSVLAKITDGKPRLTVSGEELLATQYATPIQKDGLLYAIDGRQDSGDAVIKCIDPLAQKVLWQTSGFEYGTMIGVGDDLLLLTCGGELIRIAAKSTGYEERARSTVLNSTPRGYRLPAISDGRLFVRDDDTLKCLQVGPVE